MKNKNIGIIVIILVFVALFLAMAFFTFLKRPAIVIEFKDNDILLRKIGMVGFSEPYMIVCVGNHIEAIVQTPSKNEIVCSKNCVEIIGVERIYCDELPEEEGVYSINVKVYENATSSTGKVIISKDLSGSWQK